MLEKVTAVDRHHDVKLARFSRRSRSASVASKAMHLGIPCLQRGCDTQKRLTLFAASAGAAPANADVQSGRDTLVEQLACDIERRQQLSGKGGSRKGAAAAAAADSAAASPDVSGLPALRSAAAA